MHQKIAATLLLVVTGFLAAGETTAGAASAPPKFGPGDVEVRLQDGSLIRGEIMDVQMFEFQTSFGTLKIPLSEMRNLKRGQQACTALDAKELAAALKTLGSDDAAQRAAAAKTLENAGGTALDALFEARQKTSGETRARIDALLKRVLAKDGTAERSGDLLKAAKFEGRGTLLLPGLTLKSKLGDLKLKLDDIASMQWLSAGTLMAVEVEAPLNFREWSNTGIEVNVGDTVSLAVSGQVTLYNNTFGPTGSTNWGSRPYKSGAVIVKIGEGEQILIGAGKRWTATGNGRIQVKMFCSDDLMQRDELDQSSGKFKVRIATGARSDELNSASGE